MKKTKFYIELDKACIFELDEIYNPSFIKKDQLIYININNILYIITNVIDIFLDNNFTREIYLQSSTYRY